MAIDDFTPADMQIVMMAIERVSLALKLTDSEEDMAIKAQISSLIIKCAEGGERNVQKLIDCAHEGTAPSRATSTPGARGSIMRLGQSIFYQDAGRSFEGRAVALQ